MMHSLEHHQNHSDKIKHYNKMFVQALEQKKKSHNIICLYLNNSSHKSIYSPLCCFKPAQLLSSMEHKMRKSEGCSHCSRPLMTGLQKGQKKKKTKQFSAIWEYSVTVYFDSPLQTFY